MDKINLNLFGLNYQTQVEKKEEETKAEDKKAPLNEGVKENKNPDAIFEAMKLSAAQNAAFAGVKAINPRDYLDDASIARIQGSMALFTDKVEEYSNVVKAEFPNLTEAQVQELALQAVLKQI